MKPLLVDPNNLIPWHSPRKPLNDLLKLAEEEKVLRAQNPHWEEQELDRITRYLQGDYAHYPNEAPGYQGIPPVPLMPSSKFNNEQGYYNLYEGHHRATAALVKRLLLPSYLVENDEDIAFLIEIGCNIVHGNLTGATFSAHQDLVYQLAMTHFVYEGE